MTAGVLIAGAVGLLALPSAVLAITARFEPDLRATAATKSMAPIEEEVSTSALSRILPFRSLAKGQLYPFTPAGSSNRPDRSVTVAVRVNSGAVQEVSVRTRGASKADGEASLVQIAPTAFNLGVSRGYRNFSQDLVKPGDDKTGRIADYGRFSIAPGSQSGDPSRFSPRIVIDEKQRIGQAPRTFAGDRQNRVDVGGAYRVTDHLDVTAGVRYAEDRDRLTPLTDGKQDSQAVYVGTQFRF